MSYAGARDRDLPYELLEEILLSTDRQSIVKCRQVSKAFNEFILCSTRIQYMLDLELDDLEDGPPGGLTTIERLQALRRRRIVWQSLQFLHKRFISFPKSTVFAYTGSFFLWVDSQDSLNVLQIASEVRGILESFWSVPLLVVVHLKDISADPDQDVVMLADNRLGDWAIHVRSMKTGEVHPRALRSPIHVPTDSSNPSSTVASISADVFMDLIAIEISAADGNKSFLLLNWKTCDILLNLSCGKSFSFGFLSERFLLLAHDARDDPFTLSVIDIYALRPVLRADPSIALPLLKCTCVFQWPSKLFLCAASHISIEWSFPRKWQSHNVSVPFCSSSEIIFSVCIGYDSPTLEDMITVVPTSTLLKRVLNVTKEHQVFVWNEWGCLGARLLRANYHNSYFVFTSDGTFAISYDHAHTQWPPSTGVRLFLHDFGALRFRRAQQELAVSDDPVSKSHLSSQYPYGTSSILQQNIVTYLPARITEIIMPVENGRDSSMFSAMTAAEDGLCLQYSLDDGSIECHIMSF